MADDNNLPKPITMTGSDFNDVDAKDDPFEKKEEKDQDQNDSATLPMPAVFGEEETENDEEIKELPTPTPISANDSQEEDDDPIESEPEPSLTSAQLEQDEEDEVQLPPSTVQKSEKLKEEVEDILEEVEPISKPEPVSTKEESSQPESELNKDMDLEAATNNADSETSEPAEKKVEEDTTKLPDSKVANINNKDELSFEDLGEDAELDIPSIDPVVMSQSDIEANDQEGDEMSNKDVLKNPYSEENINEAKQLNAQKPKDVVHQIAQLNDSPQVPSKSSLPKVLTAVFSLFIGGGLVVGGYFAAQNFFGTGSPKDSQVLYQQPDQPTPTPVAEEVPPQEESEATPSPSPVAEENIEDSSEETTTSEDEETELITSTKYLFVQILDTPTDWLNTRSTPTTKEDNVVKKVYPDDVFEYLGANEIGWFKIKLDTGEEVWISGKYANRLTQEEYDNLETAEEPSPTPEATEEPLEE